MSDSSSYIVMKKLSLVLAILLPLFLACNPVSNDTDFKDPAFLQYSGRLTFKADMPSTKASANALVGSVTSIELTESGLFVIGTKVNEKGAVSYRTGRYSVQDNKYLLTGVGILSFNNSASGSVNLFFTPQEGEPQQIPADFLKSKSTNKAFRTWKVEKTRVTVRGFWVASADFKGCDFLEIAEFLRNNGNKVPPEVPALSVSTISLTGTDTMIFAYSDSSADVNEFSLNGNVLTYDWKDLPLSFTFESDKAVIEYMDGKCILTIDGRIQNSTTSGTVSFVLSPTD